MGNIIELNGKGGVDLFKKTSETIFFGAVAGGIYELLEQEKYVESVADEWGLD